MFQTLPASPLSLFLLAAFELLKLSFPLKACSVCFVALRKKKKNPRELLSTKTPPLAQEIPKLLLLAAEGVFWKSPALPPCLPSCETSYLGHCYEARDWVDHP